MNRTLLQNKGRGRAFAFVLALVLAVSLIPVIGAVVDDEAGVAYAAQPNPTSGDSWTDWQNYETDWFENADPAATSYDVANSAELAGLAALVNGTAQYTTGGQIQDPYNFQGKTINLTGDADDYDLSAHYWTPIGGGKGIADGVPNAPAFSGAFDGKYNGKGKTGPVIENMTISPAALVRGNCGFGLFGFGNGASIVNVSVDGTIATSSPAVTLVGGVVGYIYGNVANCHSSVDISLPGSSSTTSNIGGIVGAIESKTTSSATDLYISYTENTGAVSGGTRTGGIVGSVYASNNGGVLVNAAYNSGAVDEYVVNSRAYAGGIVGYCQGYLSQVANVGTVTEQAGGHYVGGIAGLVQGYELPYGSIQYSYSNGAVSGSSGYTQALFATADSNANAVMTDLFWGNGSLVDQQTGSTWGTDTDVLKLTDSQFANQDIVTTSAVSDYIVNILNTPSAPTAVFVAGTSTPAIIYPEYVTPHTIDPYNFAGDQDPPDGQAVFLDGTAAAGGDGTRAHPYNNFADAASAAGTNLDIYIRGTVTVDGTETWQRPSQNVEVYRSSVFTGFLVDVVSGGDLTVNTLTIDGNWKNGGGSVSVSSKSLIEVDAGGSLTLGNGAVLRNNFADSGGAVRVNGGTATMEGATISNNQAIANGGGVAVFSPTSPTAISGTFTMTDAGGSISDNTAQLGGGIYSQINSKTTITGGIINGNTALRNGNGIYVSGNADDNHPVELSFDPAVVSGTAITLGTGEDVYLNGTDTNFSIESNLSPSGINALPLTFSEGRDFGVVAIASEDDVAENSVSKLSNDDGWTFSTFMNLILGEPPSKQK
jgi:hypothetical protein